MDAMRRFLAVLLIVLIFAGCFSTGLKVEGTEEFKQDIQAALDLLQEKAPEHYEMVNKYLTGVELVGNDGVTAINIYRKFTMTEEAYINRRDSGYKELGLAFDLVHEATHANRMKLNLDNRNDVESEEKIAVEAEIEVAKLLEAPQELIDWLGEKKHRKWW